LFAGNPVVNLIFFMTHPVIIPYYTIPVAMLSLWALLFATLSTRGEAARDSVDLRQPIEDLIAILAMMLTGSVRRQTVWR
jgi:hypothetical protein